MRSACCVYRRWQSLWSSTTLSLRQGSCHNGGWNKPRRDWNGRHRHRRRCRRSRRRPRASPFVITLESSARVVDGEISQRAAYCRGCGPSTVRHRGAPCCRPSVVRASRSWVGRSVSPLVIAPCMISILSSICHCTFCIPQATHSAPPRTTSHIHAYTAHKRGRG